MHFKNALNASIYAVSRAFFTQSLAKFRSLYIIYINVKSYAYLRLEEFTSIVIPRIAAIAITITDIIITGLGISSDSSCFSVATFSSDVTAAVAVGVTSGSIAVEISFFILDGLS